MSSSTESPNNVNSHPGDANSEQEQQQQQEQKEKCDEVQQTADRLDSFSLSDAPRAVDPNADPKETFWQACKFNEVELCKKMLESGNVDVNSPFNGNFPICIAAHKGFVEVVKLLLDNGADVNVKNLDSDSSRQGFARRSVISFDSPLNLAIKYGHTEVAELLIDNGADALYEGRFDRSPLQEAVRLGRTECLKRICESVASADAVLKRFKKEIIRQCLINDNVEAVRFFVPLLWDKDGLNSDFMMTVLNNLMLKNKVQTDMAAELMQEIMEAIPMPKVKMYDLSVLLKSFLRLLPAQFLSISDERIVLLLYRANLFFLILKYMDKFDFVPYLADLDMTFMTIYDSIRDTGESKTQVIEFMMNFYDNLIVMGYLSLNPEVISMIVNYRHVLELQKIQNYLLYKATRPLKLKELCRLGIKDGMTVYKRFEIDKLNLDPPLSDYLYFLC